LNNFIEKLGVRKARLAAQDREIRVSGMKAGQRVDFENVEPTPTIGLEIDPPGVPASQDPV